MLGVKVWNIDIHFFVFKKQIKRYISKLMSIQVWSIGLEKHIKMIENPQINPNSLGCVKK